PVIPRCATEGRPERAAEMRRVVEAPAEGDIENAARTMGRIAQLRTRPLQPPLPHPFTHGLARLLEQAMKMARGNAKAVGDSAGRQVRLMEALVDELADPLELPFPRSSGTVGNARQRRQQQGQETVAVTLVARRKRPRLFIKGTGIT